MHKPRRTRMAYVRIRHNRRVIWLGTIDNISANYPGDVYQCIHRRIYNPPARGEMETRTGGNTEQ